MPKHDLPDGNETRDNLIDIRDYLRRRDGVSAPRSDEEPSEKSDWDIYRHAEYGDGKRPGFSRHDLMWIGIVLCIGWIFWRYVFR